MLQGSDGQSRQALRVLAAIVVAHLAFCLAAVWILSQEFFSSNGVVVLHMSIVTGLVTVVIGLLLYAIRQRRLRDTPATIIGVATAATIGWTLLLTLYAGAAMGNLYWASNFNYHVAWQYAFLIIPNHAPFFVSGWIHAAFAGWLIVAFVSYWYACRLLFPRLERYVCEQGDRKTGSSERRRRLVVVTAALVGYVAGTTLLASQVDRSGLLQLEPIVGFFLTAQGLFQFNQDSIGMQVTAADRAARDQYPKQQSFEHRNVVFIVVDSLRADHMGVYGYPRSTTPFLSSLRDSGELQVVQLALSTCAETRCGVLSTMASRPFMHLAVDNFSISRLLHDQGYTVYRILSGDHDPSLRLAYGTEHTMYFDNTSSRRYALNDDEMLFEGLERVPDFQGTPAFFHFHLMSAHNVGLKHDQYRRFEPAAGPHQSLLNTTDQTARANTYDNGVVEADATIGRLFAELHKKGYLANALVVVLGDHGEGLGEHGNAAVSIGHVHSLYQEHIRIPLLFYDHSEAPYANLTLARQIDVAPTVIDRLGLPVPATWEGQSLLKPTIRPFSFHQTKRFHPCYAVVDRVDRDRALYKFLACKDDAREELYELVADPHEKNDLIDVADPALIQELRDRLKDYSTGSIAN